MQLAPSATGTAGFPAMFLLRACVPGCDTWIRPQPGRTELLGFFFGERHAVGHLRVDAQAGGRHAEEQTEILRLSYLPIVFRDLALTERGFRCLRMRITVRGEDLVQSRILRPLAGDPHLERGVVSLDQYTLGNAGTHTRAVRSLLRSVVVIPRYLLHVRITTAGPAAIGTDLLPVGVHPAIAVEMLEPIPTEHLDLGCRFPVRSEQVRNRVLQLGELGITGRVQLHTQPLEHFLDLLRTVPVPLVHGAEQSRRS